MKKIKRIIAVAALIFAVVAGGYLIHTAKQKSKTEGADAKRTEILYDS